MITKKKKKKKASKDSHQFKHSPLLQPVVCCCSPSLALFRFRVMLQPIPEGGPLGRPLCPPHAVVAVAAVAGAAAVWTLSSAAAPAALFVSGARITAVELPDSYGV